MKKIGLIIVFVLVTLIGAYAQKKVKSYGCKRAFQWSSLGLLNNPIPTYGTWLEIYDSYILVCGTTKYVFSHVNNKGNNVYVHHLSNNEWISLSPDYRNYYRRWSFSFINQTVQNQEDWVYIGEGSDIGKNFGK